MYFVEKTRGRSLLKDYDYVLLGSVLLLTAFGMLILASATRALPGQTYMSRQTFGFAIGLVLAVVISLIDYRYIRHVGFAFYGLTLLLLVIVLFIGYGGEDWGSNSWIDLGFISFQPSEFAKISYAMVMAACFAAMGETRPTLSMTLKAAGLAFLPVVLIMLQPDAGTMLVYVCMLACLLFIYGIRYKTILVGMACVLPVTPLVWFFILGDHQKARILSFLLPGSDPTDATFQVDWAKLATGSGKIRGQGLFNGLLTQNNSVPIKESDFIFSVIGEELGFIGSAAVVCLVLLILYRCIRIASSAQDLFGRFIATALTGMLAFHFIENIGMTIGVLPVTGIPMPFVSYGGTAMISNYMALGLLLSISLRRKRRYDGMAG